ncbi:HD-like signal output (HDOD) protein [Desulfobaculum xiamenense]|uniref:HD-like signal output (HDOD) protein n=1 Tax=Desulfobaculum xiamenense TaxID=995050 RepID=A0A846QQK6_9BACT|nr:HDOD domain-containing protein [Desulfobaculum xiamenense]NJB69457.1 HD-like signal output (HDOD) protein [Desulfobaculum xiamenense]
MSPERGPLLLSGATELRKDLPISPQIIQQLFAQTDEDSRASLADIAKSIAADQGLTVKVLAMANSAYYGLQTEVESPARAVALLGLDTIRCLVLGIGVKGLSAKLRNGSDFDLRAYWRHQLLTAATARLLAGRLRDVPQGEDAPPVVPDQIFTAAMLHDLGKLLTAIIMPDDWATIITLAREGQLSIAEAEDTYWGLDHGVVGALALRSWNLPPSLTEPVNWHHAPDMAPDYVLHAQILCMADALCVLHATPDARVPGPWRELLEQFALDRDQLTAEVAELAQDDGLLQLADALA